MDNRKILDEVYRDFFGTVKEEKITPIDKEIEIKNIEELLIDEDSKELLKKIITYIKNYNNGVYINFNILLYGNNKETLNAIINLLKSVSNNYLINTNITNISLADIEDINKVKDYYKSGILIISDFNSLSGKDATKLINILKDNSTYKNIVILNDTESNLKEFIKNDNELENSYFTYSIKEILPDTKYIMNDIKKSINIDNLTDIEKYISDTFLNSNLDYPTYRDNLIKKYNHQCIVTGIDTSKLLVASHIKPWRVCENEERIDTENGLLLSANMDRLFDSGLITFTIEGEMIISSFVGEVNQSRLHIFKGMKVDLQSSRRLLTYLEYHRDVLFVK